MYVSSSISSSRNGEKEEELTAAAVYAATPNYIHIYVLA